MAPQFEKTPEQQSAMLNFWRQQIFFKPAEVRGTERLQGKTAIVTGSNTGVGYQTARQLLHLGLNKLILAVRNEEKGKAAAAKLAAAAAGATIEVWLLDHSSYDSILAFAERAKGLDRLDIVNLNAAVTFMTQVFNPTTGHDEAIQVNYLSTALLAILLLPIVKEKGQHQGTPGRITFTSSEASAWTKFTEKSTDGPLLAAFDKPNPKLDATDRQWVSKLLGQFLIAKLATEVPSSAVIINGASPGTIYDSEFMREIAQSSPGVFSVAKFILKFVVNSSAVGARMITDAIVNHVRCIISGLPEAPGCPSLSWKDPQLLTKNVQGDETHGQFLSFQKMVP